MMIQYSYAVLTMLPCPIWFYSRWASAAFLLIVFAWSVYNGATYYIDVFGTRFQKELEVLKAEVTKWQNSPDLILNSPRMTPNPDGITSLDMQTAVSDAGTGSNDLIGGIAAEKAALDNIAMAEAHSRSMSVDQIPLLSSEDIAAATSSGIESRTENSTRERRSAESKQSE